MMITSVRIAAIQGCALNVGKAYLKKTNSVRTAVLKQVCGNARIAVRLLAKIMLFVKIAVASGIFLEKTKELMMNNFYERMIWNEKIC